METRHYCLIEIVQGVVMDQLLAQVDYQLLNLADTRTIGALWPRIDQAIVNILLEHGSVKFRG